MSAKALDGQGRWRCQTIGVRVSPEENAEINALAALSGMTKQEYAICRMCKRDVVVKGNPRVYKALKHHMEKLYEEFSRLSSGEDISAEMLHVLHYMAQVYDGMRCVDNAETQNC